MVVASNIALVPFRKSRLERYQVNWHDETPIYWLWEKLSVSDKDGVPLGLVLASLLSARFAS